MRGPRTAAGRAAVAALRPHVKRALEPTIARIEVEAVERYLDALRRADQVLRELGGRDPSMSWDAPTRADLVRRAGTAHERIASLLAESEADADAEAGPDDEG